MIADISTNIPSLMVWTMTACRYVAATLVEHAAVNRRVVGSSPTGGAIEKAPKALGFWSFFLFKKTDIHHLEKSMSKAFSNRF